MIQRAPTLFLGALVALHAAPLRAGERPVAPAIDCASLRCVEVLPAATRFVLAGGGKPYLVGRDAAGKTVGWVARSTDVVGIKGYSGKPLVTLIGIDTKATITGARILSHSEPILLVGIPESALKKFVGYYKGKPATATIAVGASPDPKALTVDVISGATVTVLAVNRTILDTARAVGEAVGVIKATAAVPGHFIEENKVLTWSELIRSGAMARLEVTEKQMGKPNPRGNFIDLYFAVADPPQIGKALLGVREYAYRKKALKPDEHLIVIVGNGSSSFKGSGFVRGGIFDRVRIEQGLRTLMFTDHDYKNLVDVAATGAPSFKEGAVFVAREGKLDPGRPFDLVFLGSRYDRKGGFSREFRAFRKTFQVPRSIYALDGPDPANSIVRSAWYNARYRAAVLVVFLIVLASLFFARRFLTGRTSRLKKLHLTMAIFAATVLGVYMHAQPSVTQVLTVVGSVQHGWRWELFLSEPLVFLFWIFIALTAATWGRGVFCGWACPYGAINELIYKVGRALKIPELELPDAIHNKLRWLRYLILVGLIAVFFVSPQLGEMLAEIEPFKSTFFVLPWTRHVLLFAWWILLLVYALFTYRPFCRYLCPLGAALAIPGSLRFAGPRRRNFCTSCTICTRTCEPRAIRPNGTIDPRECLQCMECEANYRDETVCPPLVGLLKLKQKGALSPAEMKRQRKLQEDLRRC